MITTDPMQETPVTLKQRRPFSLLLELLKEDRTPVVLDSDSTMRLVISDTKRRGGALKHSVECTPVDLAYGLVRFDIQASDLDLPATTYLMALTYVTEDSFETSIIEGEVEVTYNPDPVVPADYSLVAPPLSITARLLKQNKVTVRVNHVPDQALLAAVNSAATSASEAGISADNAAMSADEAHDSAVSAEGSAVSASSSAVSALASKNAAAASATAAAASAVTAAASAASATGAAGSAAAAATSAGQAAVSATNAGASAIAAAASAAAAATAGGNATYLLTVVEPLPTIGMRAGDVAVRLNPSGGKVTYYEFTTVWTTFLTVDIVGGGGNSGMDVEIKNLLLDDTTQTQGALVNRLAYWISVANAGSGSVLNPLIQDHDGGTGIAKVRKMTAAAYAALGTKVSTTLYVIVG